MSIIQHYKKEGNLAICDKWVDLKGIVVSEISQAEKNTVRSYMHVESKQKQQKKMSLQT